MKYLPIIRKTKPHVFSIMNEVASNFSANGLIAIGASPSISNTPKEAKELSQLANAVVLNVGTLSEDRAEAMLLAGKAANEVRVPVILDPIAIGATKFRTNVINDILEQVKVAAICANAGEIAVLGEALDKTTSPDSGMKTNDPNIAKKVAQKYNTVVISTGETDVITDGSRVTLCTNGHEIMENITASGCVLTAVIGAFIGISDGDIYETSIEASASYAIAGELAIKQANGPGSFIPAFLDSLYQLDEQTYEQYKKLDEIESE